MDKNLAELENSPMGLKIKSRSVARDKRKRAWRKPNPYILDSFKKANPQKRKSYKHPDGASENKFCWWFDRVSPFRIIGFFDEGIPKGAI